MVALISALEFICHSDGAKAILLYCRRFKVKKGTVMCGDLVTLTTRAIYTSLLTISLLIMAAFRLKLRGKTQWIMLSVERKLTHGNNTSLQIKNFVFFKLFTLVLNMQLFIRYTGSKSRSIIRTVALLWCRRTKLEITTFIICNTEYQDELIHVISECTCTVRQRDRFKNHILP